MQTLPEMTAREFSKAVDALKADMGSKATISTFITAAQWTGTDKPIYCAVYPTGDIVGGAEFAITGETFAEVFADLREKIISHAGVYRTRTIRKMALAIIRITGELGHCTDAALRNCGEFDPEQVTAFGELACADANEVAGKGPFTIVALGGANGAEAA